MSELKVNIDTIKTDLEFELTDKKSELEEIKEKLSYKDEEIKVLANEKDKYLVENKEIKSRFTKLKKDLENALDDNS